MAINFDFDRLSEASGDRWDKFWGEYQRQWFAGGGDPNFSADKMRDMAYASYQGYKNPPKAPGTTSGGGTQANSQGLPYSGNFIQQTLQAQYRQQERGAPEFGTLEKSMGVFRNEQGKFDPTSILKNIGHIIKDEILIYLQEQTKTYQAINEEAAMTGRLAEAYRDELLLASPEVERLGISFNELATSVGNLLKQSGKFRLLSADTIKEMALASKFTEDMGQLAGMAADFERAGLGAKDMAETVERLGIRSMSLGLNARNTTKLLDEQLKNLNQYGFKNGLEGLNKMAQKSIEFRMNMESVFTLAEKVWNPDKALEVVANLQVIGGAFGDLNDPIKLMYMATNNVEGLQDAIIGATKSLVTYNEEQGRFQVTGANLRRAKAMADEFGMSLQELTNGAVAAAERTQAATDIMTKGLVMKDEDKEFLTNLAQMKGGKMTIEVPAPLREQLGMDSEQTQIALENLTQQQADVLLAEKERLGKMTMEDIARQQVTAVENIERDVSFLRATVRMQVGVKTGEILENLVKINQASISEESKKLTDWAYEHIATKPGEVMAATEKYLSKLFPKVANVSPPEAKIMPTTPPLKPEGKPENQVHEVTGTINHMVTAKENSLNSLQKSLFLDLQNSSPDTKSYFYNAITMQ